jgi:hypothetical protein
MVELEKNLPKDHDRLANVNHLENNRLENNHPENNRLENNHPENNHLNLVKNLVVLHRSVIKLQENVFRALGKLENKF